MKKDLDSALARLQWEKIQPPYTYGDVAVLPARSKTSFGMARNGMFGHIVLAAGSAWLEGAPQFGALWLCGQGSHDVIFPNRADDIDVFCELCMDRELGPALYRCYDRKGDLLYVGSTIMRLIRRRAHEKKAHWWPQVERVTFEDFPNISDARAAEARVIRTEHPLHNRTGALTRRAA